MKRRLLLFIVLAAICGNPTNAQTKTAERQSIDKAQEKSYRSFYFYTMAWDEDMTNSKIIFSDVCIVRQSYRDEFLNRAIEVEIKQQWDSLLAQNGYNVKTCSSTILPNVYNGPTAIIKFEKARQDNINKRLQEGRHPIDSLFFTYIPSVSVTVQLDKEQQDLAARKMIENQRDDNTYKFGKTEATGIAGAETLAYKNLDNQNQDAKLPWYIKGAIGVGYQDAPLVINTTPQYKPKSEIASTNTMTVHGSLLFALLNNKIVSLKCQPFINYGLNFLSTGVSSSNGAIYDYGAGGTLGFGKKVKFQLKGEFEQRNATVTQTFDDGDPNFDSKETGNYSYTVLKYGGGLYFDFGEHDNFLELTFYKEHISFVPPGNGDFYSFESKLSLGLMAISFQYSHNYPIAGTVSYPSTFSLTPKTYWSATLYCPLTLTKGK